MWDVRWGRSAALRLLVVFASLLPGAHCWASLSQSFGTSLENIRNTVGGNASTADQRCGRRDWQVFLGCHPENVSGALSVSPVHRVRALSLRRDRSCADLYCSQRSTVLAK